MHQVPHLFVAKGVNGQLTVKSDRIIISRNGFFDRWDWPVWLILVLGVNSAYAIYSVLVLRRAAEKARHDALERLNEKLLRVLGGEKKLLAAPLAPDQVESSHSATEPSGRRSAEKDEPKLAEQIRTLLQPQIQNAVFGKTSVADALNQPASQQALPGVRAGLGVLGSIERTRFLRLGR